MNNLRPLIALAASMLLALAARLDAAEPGISGKPLSIVLTRANAEDGLSVPSGGDGANVVEENVGGHSCRRISGQRSLYMYVKADRARAPEGSHDAYLAVEFFDDFLGAVRVEYDKSPFDKGQNSAYTLGPDVIVAVGSKQWRRAILRLPAARLGHGQNHQADMRLCAKGLAVRKLELFLNQRPADYHPEEDLALLDQYKVGIGKGMELTFGTDAGAGPAALMRTLGATSVESYVTWQTVEDAVEGKWDWSRWDKQVEILKQQKLAWVPFLVTGPGYATPKWYRESEQSVPYVCLEHNRAGKIQSLWNPALRPWIDRFIKQFADRYRDSGMIESVLLGVSGTYGETLYPSGPANPPDGSGWTYKIPGDFHNHRGWWAGDRFAAKSFRDYLAARYKDTGTLNRVWQTTHASFESISPFLPENSPSPQARLDMADWYLLSMTDWAAFWVATARKYFPQTPIYLCVGGAGERELGADFTRQAQAIAPYGARLRITNEGSDYIRNLAITREVATAARAFGLDFGFEPASHVSASGNVARIYNATASGAIQLHVYSNNVLNDQAAIELWRKWIPQLQRRTPKIPSGIYMSKTSWALDNKSQDRFFAAAHELRRLTDIEFLDDVTIASPLATGVKVLAMPDAPWCVAAEIPKLVRWVESGGILVAAEPSDRPLLRAPDGSSLRDQLFAPAATKDTSVTKLTVSGPPARHFKLQIGKDDARYLDGQWFDVEGGGMFPAIPGAKMRWSGANALLHLPCDPSAEATLVLTANLTGRSLRGPNRVLVNGAQIGVIDKAGAREHRFVVPKNILAGQPLAEVKLEITTFCPKDTGGGDTRHLGIALSAVEMVAQGAGHEPGTTTPLARQIDWDKVRPLVKRIGQGATLAAPIRTPEELVDLYREILAHPDRFAPGAAPVLIPATAADLFATQTDGGVLYYNASNEPQKTAGRGVVPPHGIMLLPPSAN